MCGRVKNGGGKDGKGRERGLTRRREKGGERS